MMEGRGVGWGVGCSGVGAQKEIYIQIELLLYIDLGD
jgi:hypothetical protein